MRVLLAVCLICYCPFLKAQADLPDASGLIRLGKQYDRLAIIIQRRSNDLLATLARREAAMQRVLARQDSAAAAHLPGGYDLSAIRQMGLKEYIPGLDSVQTALLFLQDLGAARLGAARFDAARLDGLGFAQDKLSILQGQLLQANAIEAFVRGRSVALQSVLSKYDLQGKLDGYRRDAYYYKDQLQQYQKLLHEPDKLAGRVLSLVRNQSAFSSFFRQHSYLSTLFRLPASDDGEVGSGQPLPGLQTRAQVSAAVGERLGAGTDLNKLLSGQATGQADGSSGTSAAITQFDGLKEKALTAGGGASEADMPTISVNPYHNKTLWQRIQLGFDMQTQSSTVQVPALSNLGVSIGYRLNDRGLIGLGAAYKLGWGQPFEHIRLSGQGAALRSFIDWRLKGSLWLVGGYERNYLSALGQANQLYRFSVWQSSALFGLMKTYRAGRRSGNIQLLFDGLYRQHIPQSQPLVFRAGYSIL
jgi:hypothetical protein